MANNDGDIRLSKLDSTMWYADVSSDSSAAGFRKMKLKTLAVRAAQRDAQTYLLDARGNILALANPPVVTVFAGK